MEIFVLRNGEQIGPFSEETVQSQLKRGGLLPTDKAWRKGLPDWVPLGEVMNPASSEPPPVPGAGAAGSGIAKKPATAKQRALLKYLGATFAEDVSYEEAAVAICKALESPKLTSRLTKWGDEKLRLHPELFQDEIDYRRANRVSFYLDLCQGEGAKAVKDVTKAHVQVLIEALDKKNASWEVDSRAAFWDYFLPTVGEHFPQLVREEWRKKLKSGAKAKAVEPQDEDEVVISPAPAAPGVMESAIRGVLYGLVVLGVAFGTVKLYQATTKKPEAKPVPSAAAPSSVPSLPPPPLPAAPPFPVGQGPALAANPPGDLLPNGDLPNNVSPGAPPAVPVIEAAPALPVPVPVVPEKPAAENPGVPALPPAAPAASEAPAAPTPAAPEAPAAPAAPKSMLTITKPVTVQLQFGRVTLNPGTRVRFIATEGPNVRVNFNNNVILVPSAVTDVDAPAPAAPTTAPAAAPAIPPAAVPSTAPNNVPALPPASVPAGPRPTLPAVPSTAPAAIPTLPPVTPAPKPSTDL